MKHPEPERPAMAAGYLERRLLPFAWADARLTRAQNYWVTTVTGAGGPHARPVWGVWLKGALYFSSGSRIRRHLEAGSDVSVNLESGNECVILEGAAQPERDPGTLRQVADAYNAKYHWDMKPELGEFFAFRPRVGFGWLCDPSGEDGGMLYGQTATRWRFED